MPPFEIQQQYIENSLDENIKLFFLNEGKRTEIAFYKKLFSKEVNFELNKSILVHIMNKTGKDEGLSDPLAMVDKAIEWAKINNDSIFDISKDKIVITFDLDVLDKNRLDKLINKKTDYLIYVYSNPKFELPLLMSTGCNLKELEKQYYQEQFPNNILEKKFSELTHHNSKTTQAGIYGAENYKEIIKNKNYDSNLLVIKDSFFTNINFLLKALSNCELNTINKII